MLRIVFNIKPWKRAGPSPDSDCCLVVSRTWALTSSKRVHLRTTLTVKPCRSGRAPSRRAPTWRGWWTSSTTVRMRFQTAEGHHFPINIQRVLSGSGCHGDKNRKSCVWFDLFEHPLLLDVWSHCVFWLAVVWSSPSGNLNDLVQHGLRALRETLPTEQDLTTKVAPPGLDRTKGD